MKTVRVVVLLMTVVVLSVLSSAPPLDGPADATTAPIETAAAPNASLDYTFDPAADESSSTTHFDLLDQAQTQGTSSDQPAPVSQFGKEGTSRWNVYGAVAHDFDSSTVGLVSVGLSYFIRDFLSLDGSIDGLYSDQDGPNAGGAGFVLLFRWHVFRNQSNTWSAYMDGGAGMLFSTNDIPATGSSVNFMPQIGGGMSFDVGNDTRLMVGVRWFHISNANTFRDNPGRDHLEVYAGLSFPF